jgi:hypothetical protein
LKRVETIRDFERLLAKIKSVPFWRSSHNMEYPNIILEITNALVICPRSQHTHGHVVTSISY